MPEIIYSGPDGRLEGRMNVVENKRSPVAIILHPLPVSYTHLTLPTKA